MQNLHQTYYDLLEINTNASLEQIRHAYQKAKSLYSSDSQAMYSMFSEDEARELVKIIEQAYSVLSNPSARLEYDRSLKLSTPEVGQRTPDSDIFSISSPEPRLSNPHSGLESGGDPRIGQTRFGTYEKKSDMEEEIAQETEFDGGFLKRVRNYRNISIEALSQQTKIGKHHLNAIEENDFSSLPASVFVRGFVKQYADLLGLNSQKVTDAYMKLCKQSREE